MRAIAWLAIFLMIGWAREIIGQVERRVAPRTAQNCAPATSSVQLDINNVRCLIHNGGDMWWDLVGNPRYEIPKVPPGVPAIHSMFASAVWIGGYDAGGRLRLAAQTYRQSGNDFFPGPLSLQGTTDANTCQKWDRHFVITRQEINAFRAAYQANPSNLNLGNFPNLASWPAINTDPGFERFLAPFVDVNNDGDYTPSAGDYPDVLGDMAIWWVYNDKGNVHTETGAAQIGMEVQALAFAFATTDEVNNMTFYKYKLINRGTLALTQTYMGVWVDADLGFYNDDYVGCDTARGLGYCYNGDPNDNPPQGYGLNPPSIGTDFFQGPIGDDGNRLKMTNFMYYDNDFSIRGNPTNAIHFYNYMRSIWKDGSPLVANGTNGYGTGTPTNYIFTGYPGGASARGACPYNSPLPGWDEASAGNSPFDRRYLQSAGPFTLLPGAVNEIVVGVPWARDANGNYGPGGDGRIGSVCLLYKADDIAQALFDNNFQLVEGPDAPEMEIVELDRELILKWSYKNPLSNNYYENYRQRDPVLFASGSPDPFYRFEGYLIYQLRDPRVGVTDLEDPNKAALIAQCDIKNGITTIVNREEQLTPGWPTPIIVDKVMVNGKDEGLFYSLRVTEDKFAEGTDPLLVNYRRYYFMIVAYAYNGDTTNPRRFILGRNNVRSYEAIPHKVEFEKMGTALAAAYGDGVKIRRVAGQGNGGNALSLTPEAEAQALSGSGIPEYAPGAGPFMLKVVDPKLVKPYDYRLVINTDTTIRDTIFSSADTTILFKEWELYGRPSGSGAAYQLIYTSWAAISSREWDHAKNTWDFLQDRFLKGTERVIPGHGISIAVRDVLDPGTHFVSVTDKPWLCTGNTDPRTIYYLRAEEGGIIEATIEYADPTKPWLRGYMRPEFGQGPARLQGGSAGRILYGKYERCANYPGGQGQPLPLNLVEPYAVSYEREDSPIRSGLLRMWLPYHLATPYHFTDSLSELRKRLRPEERSLGMLMTRTNTLPSNSIVPYCLHYPQNSITLARLPSVLVVISPDPRKWSRTIVIEASPLASLSRIVGSSMPFTAKWRLARDVIQGDTLAYRSGTLSRATQGYSYFPGYAINLETGQRVNILYAEASWYRRDNGDDMLFNPTANIGTSGEFGGRHWVLVTDIPYDECRSCADILNLEQSNPRNPDVPLSNLEPCHSIVYNIPGSSTDTVRLDSFYRRVAWIGLLGPAGPQYEFKHYKDIPTEVRIRLAVNKSYASAPDGTPPTFEFSTAEVAARLGDVSTAKSALDLIRVVPNPYYGRSGAGRGVYEISQVDTRVKITNLPQKCTIRIFTLNGVLVRTFRKDSEAPDQEWDLKNEYGVPIASGPYIIHIDAPGIGQRVVKFFAIMPQVDLNNY